MWEKLWERERINVGKTVFSVFPVIQLFGDYNQSNPFQLGDTI